ncbi:MAG: extracellular solute-binding protein [Streptosporangiales bacterium]|nr:extracellular solute-binding protein [Streptosporangiales bacterium]
MPLAGGRPFAERVQVTTMDNDDIRAGLSRRGFLGAAAGFGVAAMAGLTACDTGYRDPATKGLGGFNIPDPKTSLPSGDVTFRLIDSGDTKKPFWDAFFDAYSKKHSNITVKYDGLPKNRMDEIIPLGIRNGTAHDVFMLPPSMTLPQAVEEKWVSPLDDLIPDIDALKKRLPPGTLADGVQIFDGKIYQLPLSTEQRYLCLLHYNKKLMDDAGYDPSTKTLTWDEYRDAAKKITKAGKGKVYGVVLEIAQPDRLQPWVDYMTRQLGVASVNGIDPKNGEYVYDRPEVLDAIELILALKSDGSLFPGSNSLTAPEAWPRLPRGAVGMVSAGPWVTVQWENDNPDFEFGVAAHPTPTDDPLPIGYPAFGGDWLSVFSKSKNKAIAGDVISYVLSDQGQARWAEIVKVGNPPIVEKAREAGAKDYSAQAKDCLAVADTMVINPEAVIVNPDTSAVAPLLKIPPQFEFGQVIQAILVGKEDAPKKALTALADRCNGNLDAAIKEAGKKGAKVSREDYVFSNWDPKKDYLPADYKGR